MNEIELLWVHVLIDTWWNVNDGGSKAGVWLGSVLIDTWWNVNTFSSGSGSSAGACFNRYMVECEFGRL